MFLQRILKGWDKWTVGPVPFPFKPYYPPVEITAVEASIQKMILRSGETFLLG